MTLWIGPPSVVIPELSTADAQVDPDRGYLRIYAAFGQPVFPQPSPSLSLPRASEDREHLAAAAILPLLNPPPRDHKPDFLVDCYSSAAIGGPAPTYKLAMMTSLSIAPPLSINGQGGAEVGSALFLLRSMAEVRTIACALSAVQQVVAPDPRASSGRFPLGDGAVAALVTSSPQASRPSFRVLSVALTHDTTDWFGGLDSCLGEALVNCGRRKASIQWTIAQQLSGDFVDAVASLLPGARRLTRPAFMDVNFGSADCLVTLAAICKQTQALKDLQGVGAVCFGGTVGAVGVALLKLEESR